MARVVCSLCVVFQSLWVEAATPGSATTIDEVLSGVSRSAGTQIAAALTEVALAERDQIQGEQFPTITLDSQDTVIGDAIASDPEHILRVEQMLLDWGHSAEDLMARESAVESRKSGDREVVLESSLQSAEAFYSIYTINQKLASNQDHRQSLQELQEMMQRRVESNVSPVLDLQEVTARINLLDVADQRLNAERRQHQLRLIRLAGVNVEQASTDNCLRPSELDEEALVTEALAFSPTLQRIRHEEDVFTFDERALEATRLPGLVGGYRADSKMDGDQFDQRAYLALRYEFRTGGDLAAKIAATRAKYLEQRALHRRDAEIIAETVGAWVSTYRTSAYLVDTYERIIASKIIQKDSHLRRFLVGRSSWRDVLGAQNEIVDSTAAQIDASGAICLASVSLSLLTGRDLELE